MRDETSDHFRMSRRWRLPYAGSRKVRCLSPQLWCGRRAASACVQARSPPPRRAHRHASGCARRRFPSASLPLRRFASATPTVAGSATSLVVHYASSTASSGIATHLGNGSTHSFLLPFHFVSFLLPLAVAASATSAANLKAATSAAAGTMASSAIAIHLASARNGNA